MSMRKERMIANPKWIWTYDMHIDIHEFLFLPTRPPTFKFLTELPIFVMIPTPIAIAMERYEYESCQYHRRHIEDTLY